MGQLLGPRLKSDVPGALGAVQRDGSTVDADPFCPGALRVKHQEHPGSAAENQLTSWNSKDFAQAKDTAIKRIGLLEIIDVNGGFENPWQTQAGRYAQPELFVSFEDVVHSHNLLAGCGK